MEPDIKEEKQEEPKPLVMTVTLNPNGQMDVAFSMLANQMLSYGFLKMAEKTLDKFYKDVSKPKIVKPHGIMDFARSKH